MRINPVSPILPIYWAPNERPKNMAQAECIGLNPKGFEWLLALINVAKGIEEVV